MNRDFSNYTTEDFIANIFSAFTAILDREPRAWSIEETDDPEICLWIDDDGEANLPTSRLPKMLLQLLDALEAISPEADYFDCKEACWDVIRDFVD